MAAVFYNMKMYFKILILLGCIGLGSMLDSDIFLETKPIKNSSSALVSTNQSLAEYKSNHDVELLKQIEESKTDLLFQNKLNTFCSIVSVVLTIILVIYIMFYFFNNKQITKGVDSQIQNAKQNSLLLMKQQEAQQKTLNTLYENLLSRLAFVISSIDNINYTFNVKDKSFDKSLKKIKNQTSKCMQIIRIELSNFM